MIDIKDIPILNKQTINTIKLQANGNNSIIREIFESFVYDVQDMINQIDNAVKNADYKQFKILTHTIKGLSATIGASQLHFVSKEMDFLLKEDKKEEAVNLIPSLVQIYNTCKQLVKEEFKIV
jgi:HPt (histidine-containing phosphotransfer) domain-containing protein